jgi:hypothetical protein
MKNKGKGKVKSLASEDSAAGNYDPPPAVANLHDDL